MGGRWRDERGDPETNLAFSLLSRSMPSVLLLTLVTQLSSLVFPLWLLNGLFSMDSNPPPGWWR